MAKLERVAGAVSQSINIFIQDSTKTDGTGLAGLVYNTANLIAYYTFTGVNAGSVAIALATLAAVNSAYSSGGFKEIDATNMKGLYRLDLPNAVIAAGKGNMVTIYLSGAANMAPCLQEIELTGWDNQDAVHGGMSALPNAAANAAGGLPISIAGALDLDEMNADIEAIQTGVIVTTNNDKTGYALTSAYDPAKTASQAGDAMSLTSAERNASADVQFTRSLGTESYAAKGTVPTLAQAVFMLLQNMQEFSVSSTTVTIKKLDGATTAMTYTLDATTPTSRTRAT